MEVLIGKSGLVFRGDTREGKRVYCLRANGGSGPEAVFTRADLVHLRDRAAHFDRHAETDAVYDGPSFTAARECRPPFLIGVKLAWARDGGSSEIFFQGNEWNQFLELLDTVCANERVA